MYSLNFVIGMYIFLQKLMMKAQSEAIEIGAINENAREVISELNDSLVEQPPSVVLLLQQPPQSASPTIPPPQLSMGPDRSCKSRRAEEAEGYSCSTYEIRDKDKDNSNTTKE